MVGKRDYEESYLNDYGKGTIDTFHGRSNINNKNIEVRDNPNAKDFWFCTTCEKRLSFVEERALKTINEFRRKKKSNEFNLIKSEKGNDYFSIEQNNAEIELFFYSILWRLVILHLIDKDKQIVTPEIQELLRGFLVKWLPNTPKERIEKKWKTIPYIILMPIGIELGRVFIFTVPFQNPTLFFITEFVFLLFQDGFSDVFDKDDFELSGFLDNELLIKNNDPVKIGIIDCQKWDAIFNKYVSIDLQKYLSKWMSEIAKVQKISLQSAKIILIRQMKQLMSEGNSATESALIAFKELTNNK